VWPTRQPGPLPRPGRASSHRDQRRLALPAHVTRLTSPPPTHAQPMPGCLRDQATRMNIMLGTSRLLGSSTALTARLLACEDLQPPARSGHLLQGAHQVLQRSRHLLHCQRGAHKVSIALVVRQRRGDGAVLLHLQGGSGGGRVEWACGPLQALLACQPAWQHMAAHVQGEMQHNHGPLACTCLLRHCATSWHQQ
jgi:hypothetical protein